MKRYEYHKQEVFEQAPIGASRTKLKGGASRATFCLGWSVFLLAFSKARRKGYPENGGGRVSFWNMDPQNGGVPLGSSLPELGSVGSN